MSKITERDKQTIDEIFKQMLRESGFREDSLEFSFGEHVGNGTTLHAKVVAVTEISPLSGVLTVDGVSLVDNDSVLLSAQTNQIDNGIWKIKATGDWTRPQGFKENQDADGTLVVIRKGDNNSDSLWLISEVTGTGKIGTDPLSAVRVAPAPLDLDDLQLSSSTALDISTVAAEAGTSTLASRSDHVHKFDSAPYALKSTTLTASTGLSGGGDLSANRSFALANTAVIAGAYTAANITIDAQGRITAAANGSGGGSNPATDNTTDLGTSLLRWKTLHLGPASLVVHNDLVDEVKATVDFSAGVARLVAADRTTASALGTGISVLAGAGGVGTGLGLGGLGGGISIVSGGGGANNGAGGGVSGAVAIAGGIGANGFTGTVGRTGGAVSLTGGNGGTSGTAAPAGTGGLLLLRGGNGGIANPLGTTSSAIGGNGGSVTLEGGIGGAASSIANGGPGGAANVFGGFGSPANASFAGRVGGTLSLRAGAGGAGSSSFAGGPGGSANVTGGLGGSNLDALGGAGGATNISGGRGSDSTFSGSSPGSNGGSTVIRGGGGGIGTGFAQGGNGGSVFLFASSGGNGTAGVAPAGAGGSAGMISLLAGSGGFATPTVAGKNGGAVSIEAGGGGAGIDGTLLPGVGGSITIVAGPSGLAGSGFGADGGSVSIDAGTTDTITSVNGSITIGGTNAESVNIGRASGKLGLMGAVAVVQQLSAALTNSVAIGGTTDTISDFTDLSVYANDAAAIRNDIYQLSRKLEEVVTALRNYGLLA